eukprot:Phypoly_transcript_05019.p1 GENE.Phypoly_transcript_05019~~Phypoly_transcript_05019.p1  ORF type:complete len:339 (+),score=42.09 Phypoly_transcript_05019:526-1542(+)
MNVNPETSAPPSVSFTNEDPMLALPINDFSHLATIISHFVKIKPPSGLQSAIHLFTKYVQNELTQPDWNFYHDLLPNIQSWATDKTYIGQPILLLAKHQSTTVELEEEFVRHIISAAFFGNIKCDKQLHASYGWLNFWQLYSADIGVSVARIMCLLCYFYVIKLTPPSGHKITFQRLSFNNLPPTSSSYSGPMPPDWRNINSLINTQSIYIHDGRMEAAEATAFVDFANRDLHIHQVIASATQEEVLFSCCPEAFPGLLFCERLLDDEVIMIKGCRRFCDYSGYLHTFEFMKAFIPPLPAQDIIKNVKRKRKKKEKNTKQKQIKQSISWVFAMWREQS